MSYNFTDVQQIANMRKIHSWHFKTFEKDANGYILLPCGDYSRIKRFRMAVKASKYCIFGNNTTFFKSAIFGFQTLFGNNCTFKHIGLFGNSTKFGNNCVFEQMSIFGNNTTFGDSCVCNSMCLFEKNNPSQPEIFSDDELEDGELHMSETCHNNTSDISLQRQEKKGFEPNF